MSDTWTTALIIAIGINAVVWPTAAQIHRARQWEKFREVHHCYVIALPTQQVFDAWQCDNGVFYR